MTPLTLLTDFIPSKYRVLVHLALRLLVLFCVLTYYTYVRYLIAIVRRMAQSIQFQYLISKGRSVVFCPIVLQFIILEYIIRKKKPIKRERERESFEL